MGLERIRLEDADNPQTTTPKRPIRRIRLDRSPRPDEIIAPRITLLDAVRDPKLFLPSFSDPDDWEAWWAFIAACFAYEMTPDQQALFEKCTGRKAPPSKPV